MDPALALPARRIFDLLSSGLGARAKSRRETMDQPRVDPDQELVNRTQSGDAGAFDELVIKYTPRLYGLVYNMTSNHEDTNDLLQDIFAKAYRAIRGMPHAEISKILRVSEGTVRSRLFYANRQLQNYLDEFRKNPVS